MGGGERGEGTGGPAPVLLEILLRIHGEEIFGHYGKAVIFRTWPMPLKMLLLVT